MSLLSKSSSPFARQLFSTILAQRLEIINYHLRFYSQCKTAVDNTQKPEFRFSLPNGNLTNEQRQSYEKTGFVVIRNLVKSESLELFRKRFQDVCTGKVKVLGMTVMKDVAIAKSEFANGEKAITKIQDFTLDDEFDNKLILFFFFLSN
ncbi:unnamed protein product [Rotaria sp. Silwood2]|nr:unnamed protein product [Rotaria sp. Silwood2]